RGIFGRSGWGFGTACKTTKPSLLSRTLRQDVLVPSQLEQKPATSPASAASRTSATPLSPSMSCIGSLLYFISSLGISAVVEPAASEPIFTSVLDSVHLSRLVIPLLRVKAQMLLIRTGAPTHSNFAASKAIPLAPSAC